MKKLSKKRIIIVIVVSLLLIATLIVILLYRKKDNNDGFVNPGITYGKEQIVTNDDGKIDKEEFEKTLQKAYAEANAERERQALEEGNN